MWRREVMLGGLAVVMSAGGALAQSPARPRHIGLFHVGLDHVPPSLPALRRGLADLGYRESANLRFDWRNQANEAGARRAADAFVRDGVDLIVPIENQALRAAAIATKRIPIFFMQVVDPIGMGVVQSFARPGGNVTGLVAPDLTAKRVELFAELDVFPRRILGLATADDARAEAHSQVRAAARDSNVELIERIVTARGDIEKVFAEFAPGEVGGLFIMSVSLGTNFQAELQSIAAQRHVPIIAHRVEWVKGGALLSYGVDFGEMGRVAALYVDKILKGVPPEQMPIDEAAGIRLVVNLNVARSLGIGVPQSLLLRADTVVE